MAEERTSGESDTGDAAACYDVDLMAEPALVAEGWVVRFLSEGRRADEAMQVYADLGFDVLARPVAPDMVSPLCAQCLVSSCPRHIVIYTRRHTMDREVQSDERDG